MSIVKPYNGALLLTASNAYVIFVNKICHWH